MDILRLVKGGKILLRKWRIVCRDCIGALRCRSEKGPRGGRGVTTSVLNGAFSNPECMRVTFPPLIKLKRPRKYVRIRRGLGMV